jgi:hypothetical protein
MWESDLGLLEVIKNAWIDSATKSDMGDIRTALKQVMETLHKWGGRKFGNVTRQISTLWRKLENLLAREAHVEEICPVMDTMNDLLYKEEMLWLQRFRIEWLKEGVPNRNLFHNKAVWRAKKNKSRPRRTRMVLCRTHLLKWKG